MNQSEQINELAAALAKAQGMFPDIPRNRSVKVTMKSGGSYNFKYATLDSILEAVRKPLSENGLSLACYLHADDKGELCATRLMHSSGQWIECSFPIIVDAGANAQGWGSALTYAKRNGVSALLALHADEDDDGNSACGNIAEPQQAQRTAPKAAAKQASTGRPKIWEDYTESEKIAFTEKRIQESKGNYKELRRIEEKFSNPDTFKGVSEENCKYLIGLLENALAECEALQA